MAAIRSVVLKSAAKQTGTVHIRGKLKTEKIGVLISE
jgi:hypothetical protein